MPFGYKVVLHNYSSPIYPGRLRYKPRTIVTICLRGRNLANAKSIHVKCTPGLNIFRKKEDANNFLWNLRPLNRPMVWNHRILKVQYFTKDVLAHVGSKTRVSKLKVIKNVRVPPNCRASWTY